MVRAEIWPVVVRLQPAAVRQVAVSDLPVAAGESLVLDKD